MSRDQKLNVGSNERFKMPPKERMHVGLCARDDFTRIRHSKNGKSVGGFDVRREPALVLADFKQRNVQGNGK